MGEPLPEADTLVGGRGDPVPLEDRGYGLRDVTIAGLDGLDLRFATHLADIQGPLQA